MSQKIMVVDDEERLADTLALILQGSGYETITAYEGASALARCFEFRPDLVLADVMMPGMSGIDLADAISQQFPKCKVVLFSGQPATAKLSDHARKQGHSFVFLSKPVHPKDLLKKVAKILACSEADQVA